MRLGDSAGPCGILTLASVDLPLRDVVGGAVEVGGHSR